MYVFNDLNKPLIRHPLTKPPATVAAASASSSELKSAMDEVKTSVVQSLLFKRSPRTAVVLKRLGGGHLQR